MRPLPAGPFLYPITDRRLAGGRPLQAIMASLCAGGAPLIQVREKNLTTRELTSLAADAVESGHAGGALVLINDRADVARFAGADGVHLGDDELPPAAAREFLGDDAIIGVSCHSIEDVRSAERQPVDYIAVGPVFPTDTKELRYRVAGTDLVRAARSETDKPLIAIGGITPERAREVIAAGADGLAVIAALMRSGDIAVATRHFTAVLTSKDDN